MAQHKPRVTIGIPVFNGGATIRSTIDSVLSQTFDEFEVLVLDNASTDSTEAICREVAEKDSRVRYVRNESNIGLYANFDRVYRMARGEYFRWLGDNDGLHPEYLETVVPRLDDDPGAVIVTTFQEHIKPGGAVLYEEYEGERPSGDDPIDRLSIMLRLLTGKRLWIDPIYSLIRRSAVSRDSPIGSIRFADQILACELALEGRFVHVPTCLAYRGWAPPPSGRKAFGQYSGAPVGNTRTLSTMSYQRLIMLRLLMVAILSDPDLTLLQRARGVGHVGSFGVRVGVLRVWRYGLRVTRRQSRFDED